MNGADECCGRHLRGVHLAAGTERGRAAQQIPIATHEVSIASKVGLRVQPWQHLLEEVDRLRTTTAVDGAGERELAQPDLADAVLVAQIDSLRDKVFQVLWVSAVPVHRQTADVAIRAPVHERLEPVEALVRAVAVGHAGADESRHAGVRGDVVMVGVDGIGWRHVGLRRVIWLVETQDVFASAGKGRLDSCSPAAEHLAAPEHGNIFGAQRQESVGGHIPVIRPGDSLGHRLDQRRLVVGSTALGAGALVLVVGAMGGCDGRGGHEGGSGELEGHHFDEYLVFRE